MNSLFTEEGMLFLGHSYIEPDVMILLSVSNVTDEEKTFTAELNFMTYEEREAEFRAMMKNKGISS